jgi:hypothetical protein
MATHGPHSGSGLLERPAAAEPDNRGPLFELLAKLNVQLGGVAGELEHIRKERAAIRKRSNAPAFVPIPGWGVGIAGNAPTVPASGTLLLDHGGPQLGRRWLPRGWVVSDGANFWTSMGSGQAVGVVGRADTTTHVAPFQVRWAFSSLPNVATFGSEDITVNYGEHLYTMITTGNNGQNISAAFIVQDFDLLSPEIFETV